MSFSTIIYLILYFPIFWSLLKKLEPNQNKKLSIVKNTGKCKTIGTYINKIYSDFNVCLNPFSVSPNATQGGLESNSDNVWIEQKSAYECSKQILLYFGSVLRVATPF